MPFLSFLNGKLVKWVVILIAMCMFAIGGWFIYHNFVVQNQQIGIYVQEIVSLKNDNQALTETIDIQNGSISKLAAKKAILENQVSATQLNVQLLAAENQHLMQELATQPAPPSKDCSAGVQWLAKQDNVILEIAKW